MGSTSNSNNQYGMPFNNDESNEIPIYTLTTPKEFQDIIDKFASEYFEEISDRGKNLLKYHIHFQANLVNNNKQYLKSNLRKNAKFLTIIIAGMAHDYDLRWIEEENLYQHEFIVKLSQHPMMHLEKEYGKDAIIHRMDVMHYIYKGNPPEIDFYTHAKMRWIAECKRMKSAIKFIRDKNSTPQERIKLIWNRLCSDLPLSLTSTTEFKSEYDVLSKLSEYSEDYPDTLIRKIKNSLAASNSRKNNKELNQFNVQLGIGTIERIEIIANHLNIRKRDVIDILVNSEMAMQICIDAVRRKAECELKDRLHV
jgi:hypothetical protein